MSRILYICALSVSLLGVIFAIRAEAAPSMQNTCPLTPQIVGTMCSIPGSVELTKSRLGSCRVDLPVPDLDRGILEQVLLPNKRFDDRKREYVPLTLEELRQDSVQKMWQAAGIYTVYDQKRSSWAPRLEEVPGVGDAAWYIRYPLLTRESRLGLRDPGFVFYVVHQGQVAQLRSGGADFAKLEQGRYVPMGGGCSIEEVARIAKEVTLSSLENAAGEEEKQIRERAERKKELQAEVARRRMLAEKQCPSLAELTSRCTGPSRPSDVQAFDLAEMTRKGYVGAVGTVCLYTAPIQTDPASSSFVGISPGDLFANELVFLKTVVNKVKTKKDADLVYRYTFQPFIAERNIAGRNEIGTQSLRTNASLGFSTPNRVVTITQGKPNRTCTSEELRKVGALFEKS